MGLGDSLGVGLSNALVGLEIAGAVTAGIVYLGQDHESAAGVGDPAFNQSIPSNVNSLTLYRDRYARSAPRRTPLGEPILRSRSSHTNSAVPADWIRRFVTMLAPSPSTVTDGDTTSTDMPVTQCDTWVPMNMSRRTQSMLYRVSNTIVVVTLLETYVSGFDFKLIK